MPRKYSFYSKHDSTQEAIGKTVATGRLAAAKYFAAQKQLPLKSFLKIFGVK